MDDAVITAAGSTHGDIRSTLGPRPVETIMAESYLTIHVVRCSMKDGY